MQVIILAAGNPAAYQRLSPTHVQFCAISFLLIVRGSLARMMYETRSEVLWLLATTLVSAIPILLPACLLHAGDLSLVSEFTEADTADAVLTQNRVGTTAHTAARVGAGGKLGLFLRLDDHALLSHVYFLP